MKRRFWIITVILFCNMVLNGKADIPPNMTIEDAARSAYSLMIGLYGYSEEEAKRLRYEAYIIEGNMSTNVDVYISDKREQHFALQYLYDGSLIERNSAIPLGGYELGLKTMTLEDAMKSAYHLLIGQYGYSADVAASFRYEAEDHKDLDLIHVNVYPFAETDDFFSLEYWYDGRLMSMVIPEILNFEKYDEYVKKTNRPFQWFTHEERAAYSEAFVPKVEALKRIKSVSHEIIYHQPFTNCIYGVPDEQDMDEKKAVKIARDYLMNQFGLSEKWIRDDNYLSYFDITNPTKHLWKFVFILTEGGGNYVVRVAADTGDVVRAFRVTAETRDEELY